VAGGYRLRHIARLAAGLTTTCLTARGRRPAGPRGEPALTAEHSGADFLAAARADAARRPDRNPRPAVGVLADRLAAALVHHEPGWRLPRHTALARRYNVSPAEIETAVAELVSRHLIRRLTDGQLYRASPAEYLIELEGVSGLTSSVDPMGGELACRSRQVSWRRVPEDIGWALGLATSDAVCVLRFLWEAGGEPAACLTTYLPGEVARHAAGTDAEPPDDGAALPEALSLLPLSLPRPGLAPGGQAGPARAGRPRSLHIEMQPPPPAVARSLRLPAGQPATIVTVRFDDPADARPVALTVAVLRPDLFRVVLQSPQVPLSEGGDGSLSGAWTHAVEDWEP
jgi:DNA-binding GntR family transcriptional regulator